MNEIDECPHCAADCIEGEGVVITPGAAYQECYCPVCESTWTQHYTAAEITDLEVIG